MKKIIIAAACAMLPRAAAAQVPAPTSVTAQSTPASRDSAALPYRNAVTTLTAQLAGKPNDAVARSFLVRALSELGRYDEAESTAAAGGNALLRMLGEVQLNRGKRDAAMQSLEHALAAHVADSAAARLDIAIMHYYGGRRADAIKELEWFIPFYNNAPKLTSQDLSSVGQAVTMLGATDPQLFHDAVKAYEEAGKQDARNVDSRILEAGLFLEKFDSRNATPIIMEALAVEPGNPRALVQLARARQFDGSDEAVIDVDRALAVNPNLVDALVFKAQLLAASEDYRGAQQLITKALAVNPASLDALAIQGATAYISGDNGLYNDSRKRANAIDPADTKVLTRTSAMAADARRFVESITLAQQAVAIDSTAWDAKTLQGLGEFRIGRFDNAARTLAAAFKGDPYNPWVKNTLDLLDTYPQYETRSSNRFDLVLNRKEADLIALYMQPLAEAAYDTFSTRYKWKPDEKIRIEVYPRHADFSVRTVGLSGLGALGVSFGDILAMDSPSSRPIGEFHWASTMWHEVAHTFTLGLSKMKVPRWLTEGISGWEEEHAHQGWGDPITPSFLAAYAAGKLPPVSQMTPAFVHPAYPEQVIHAYAMAQLIIDEIATTRGVDAVRRMVAAYGDGKSQADVMKDVLKVTPEQFDAEFDQYMKKRFAIEFASLEGGSQGAFGTAMTQARLMMESGDDEGAAKALDHALTLFPDYAGPGSPYVAMAQLEIKRGNDAGAIQWLSKITQRYAQDYESWIKLSELREKTGDRKGAIAALQQAMYVHPYDIKQHDRFAKLLTADGNLAGAVRERRAIVALNPQDHASAYYQLALALEAVGDKAGARTEVLKSLEAAPGYALAQELLLRLQGGK